MSEHQASLTPLRHNWRSDGVDWRDSSMDEEMARDWLRATRIVYGSPIPTSRPPAEMENCDEVMARVRELMQGDLDPPRAWRIAKKLIELAEVDTDLFSVGRNVLVPLVTHHRDLVEPELASFLRNDPRYQKAVKSQISPILIEMAEKYAPEA